MALALKINKINGEGELKGQPANPGSPGKMTIKTESVCGGTENNGDARTRWLKEFDD